ncbi:MAG: sulfurtransferase complex subunit TusB [Hyphomicrobiales bacterium]|nr:sulfurtransferase complex subunit TusB [Hyphomicrobiales bacterium]
MLHTVNKSPFERTNLKSCLRLAGKGDAIMLIEDAVYAAVQGTAVADTMAGAKDDFQVYVMGPDLDARGISRDSVIDGINVVGYDGFVDLVVEHETSQAWL